MSDKVKFLGDVEVAGDLTLQRKIVYKPHTERQQERQNQNNPISPADIQCIKQSVEQILHYCCDGSVKSFTRACLLTRILTLLSTSISTEFSLISQTVP